MSKDSDVESSSSEAEAAPRRRNFIRNIIDADLEAGKYPQGIVTRFPPEPNGYMHIGHAKSVCLNFGLALDYPNARCHLRFDDTNPATEDTEYVEAMQRDIRWLGFDWREHLYFTSNYFERMYRLAEELIERDLAYVDSLSAEEIREYRGSLTSPGRPSPYRDRTSEESLDLFRRMRAGEFEDGEHVLRAKIDLESPNLLMRDPVIYRIRKMAHHRTGDAWCIYPMYDYAHCLGDTQEGVTHSICTLEFENNRELYDWFVRESGWEHQPKQIEFARLALEYTVMSKRKLIQLVKEGHVSGWDDPRMPTIAGLRRRGYTPESIRSFCDMIGVAKANSMVDFGKLEFAVRDDLNHRAPRVMAVLEPLKVTLTNYPEGKTEELEASYWPPDVNREGSRKVPFAREIFIERADFAEEPPKGFKRLSPGATVRLRYAYVITCDEVIKDEQGEVVELRCTVDLSSVGTEDARQRKVSGVIHWVAADASLPATVRLYDRLFEHERPGERTGDFLDDIYANSLRVIEGARVEPSLKGAAPESHFQFTRQGYFITDLHDSTDDGLVFNRVVTLRDSWTRRQAKAAESRVPREERATEGVVKAPKRVRPPKRSKVDIRAAARVEDAVLAERFTRYQGELGLSESDADLLSGGRSIGDFFEAAVAAGDDVEAVTKWMVNDVIREVKDGDVSDLAFDGAALGELAAMTSRGDIPSAVAKKVFAELCKSGGSPLEIVASKGWDAAADDDAVEAAVRGVLEAQADALARYRGGQVQLMGFFVGQVMRALKGQADPALVKRALTEALGPVETD